MKLLASQTSPYARKLRVLALELEIDLAVIETAPMDDGAALLAANPAALLGVAAGALELGREADLALINPAKPWVVNADKMAASAGNTPFDKQGVEGRVLALFKGGSKIH